MIMLSLIMQRLMRPASRPRIVCLITMMCWQRKIRNSDAISNSRTPLGAVRPTTTFYEELRYAKQNLAEAMREVAAMPQPSTEEG